MGLVQLVVPYFMELESYMIDARSVWSGAIDCKAVYRMPIGYGAYLSPFVAALGDAAGVKTANMVALAGVLGAALALFAAIRGHVHPVAAPVLRLPFALTWDRAAASLLLLALIAYPYTILDVSRTTEALPATALVVTFLWAMFTKPRFATVVAVALCIGVGTHVRANMVSLILPAALWIGWRSDEGLARRCVLGLVGLALVAAAYAAYSMASTGCGWYTPTNGGYNIFAGNNPFSAEFLWAQQNGEYSIVPAMKALGITVTDAFQVPQETYFAQARQYALSCPACIVKLMAVKAAVFFSPRLLNANNIAEVVVQSTLMATTFAALCLALWRFLRTRAYLEGMILLLVVAYAAPFIVTNADPRMRFPLDIVALFYIVLRADEWLRRRFSQGAPRP